MTDNLYLIKFTYDYYCQGYEKTVEYALVFASCFEVACEKIPHKYRGAREFENLTIL